MRAKLAGPNPLQTQFDGLRVEHTEVQAQLAEARKQNETLTAERDALKTAAAAPNPLQQELETVRADMARAQAELAATRTECAALKAAAVAPNPMTAELQELRDKFAAVRMENETVKGQLTMAVAERDTARKRLDEIDTVKSEAQSEAAAGRRQLATLTHERDDARKQIGAITAERDEARRQLAQREEAGGKTLLAAENARKEINRLKTEAIALTSERERLKSQCAEAASKNKELQQRVDGMLEALQTRDRAGNGGKATDNSEELAAVRQQLAEKEKALAELKAKNLAQLAAAATAARAAQKNATATLEARATAAEAEARKFAADAEIARQMVETMRTERNDAAKRVGAVEAQLHERDSEFKLANENAKMLKEKLIEADRLSNAAREMTQTVATERDRLTIDLGRLRTELSTVNEELRKTKAECDKYRAHAGPPDPEHEQLRKTEAERDALKGELEAVKAGLERTKQHVNVLQTRRDQMRDEIARLKVALGQAPDAVG
jgi:chromosome segregation ATPase